MLTLISAMTPINVEPLNNSKRPFILPLLYGWAEVLLNLLYSNLPRKLKLYI